MYASMVSDSVVADFYYAVDEGERGARGERGSERHSSTY